MPFLEVLAPEAALDQPDELVAGLTAALAGAWGIAPGIITTYLVAVPLARYGHAGRTGAAAGSLRVFVKVHAFRRDAEARQRAAAALAATLVAAGVPSEAAIVYFLDRAPDEVAHGGRLESAKP
jgi:phenylpyruvate tautomerase PptA (4-oxalocrotonate tautomerase family)